MGRLFDALKKKINEQGRSNKYLEGYYENQAKTEIIKLFNKLPEPTRTAMLDEYISTQAKDKNADDSFNMMLRAISEQGNEPSRKFLTNNQNFGRKWQELLPLMEDRMEGWVEDSYKDAGVSKRSPAEDRLVALFRSDTFCRRMNFGWDLVEEKRKPAYRKQFLARITDKPELCARHFSEEGTFAAGKSWEKFAEAVEKAVDKASLREAEKNILAIREPEHGKKVAVLRDAELGALSNSDDRRTFLMQNAMLTAEEELDPDDLKEKAFDKKWRTKLDPLKKAQQLKEEGKLDLGAVVERSRRIISETEYNALLCKQAALQNYRNLSQMIPAGERDSQAYREMSRHAAELQADVVKGKYPKGKKTVEEGRKLMTEQVTTLTKVKKGFMLSSTNSPEHERMMKSLKLFNAKLDMTLDGKTSQVLTDEEREKVQSSDIKDLFDQAKKDSFNYSCLKTKYGKSGIIHDDGKDRNKAARNVVDILNQVGSVMGLEDRATRMKDEVALEVLRMRGSSSWEKKNAENYAAKTIYALSLTHGGVPDDKQRAKLTEHSLQKHIEEIKQRPEFKQMVKDLGPEGLCGAIVKGGDAMTKAYAKAIEKVNDPQAAKNKKPVEMTPEQSREFWAKQQKQQKQPGV